MKGYKVFNPDWTCRGFQFEVGKIFEDSVVPDCCNVGFHFCTKASDCFNYYSFDQNNKVAEVEALGQVDTHSDDSKCATNKIHIIRELTWDEVLELVNTGKGCTGFCNSGNRNSGDCNSGNRNSGDWNSGDCNSGNRNSGDCNSGDCNSGNRNSGNRNSGNRNSGDWNKTNHSNGCFGTIENNIPFFNKPSDWTYKDWLYSDARYLLNRIDFTPTEWIYSSDMTDEEKQDYPEHEITGGYLKIRNTSNCCVEWWNNLNKGERNVIMSMPNFDKEVFKEITGIDVDKL